MPLDERQMGAGQASRSSFSSFGCPLIIIGFVVLLILVALLFV